MDTLKLHILNAKPVQREALCELADILQVHFDSGGVPVYLEQISDNKNGIKWENGVATIYYYDEVQIYRTMGLLVESLRSNTKKTIVETPWHTLLAPMVDCSRNAVNTVDCVKQLVRHLALMGYNSLMLYTEDTYEIPGQPYFGYMRGRYTAHEIQEIDRYCLLFGIELIPCIQVLAHLGTLNRWKTYDEVFDVADILLVDEPKTYEFIEQMFQAVTSMFTSKQINLGMDEAFLLGCGKYLTQHGYQTHTQIMQKHLQHIMKLCRKYGLKPMMWSDMFFRTSAEGKTRHYYDTQTPLPEGVQETAPSDIALVFWDYYHKEVSNIDKLLELHQTFNNDIIFAGGAWTWKGFGPFNEVSLVYSRAALESCKKHSVSKLLLTIWKDGGCESSVFSILPVLQLFAEGCYCNDTTNEHVAKRLLTCAQAHFDDFMGLDLLNRTDKNPIAPDVEAGLTNPPNPCRYLFWQDILQGLYDKHVENNIKPEDYMSLIPMYREASSRNPRWSYIFDTAIVLCEVLALKTDIGITLRQAYRDGNRSALQTLTATTLPEIANRVSAFHYAFYQQWKIENKIFGYDVLDMRFGALEARIKTASKRLSDYLNGVEECLPELEEEILWADCGDDSHASGDTHVHCWWQCTTVGTLVT